MYAYFFLLEHLFDSRTHIFCEPGVSPVQVDLTFENMGKDNIGVIGTAASIFAFLFSPEQCISMRMTKHPNLGAINSHASFSTV